MNIDHEKYNHGLKGGEQDWRWIDQYAYEVVTNKRDACKNVILACERHLKDRETNNFYLSDKRITRVIKFCNLLKHTSTDFGGFPFLLEPWQIFIIGSLFGWLTDDYDQKGRRLRRYKTADIFIPRKNGKSWLCSAISLYGLIMDAEMGAQVISGATSREQAKIVFDHAKNALRASPFASVCKILESVVEVPDTNSVMKAVSKEANTLEGLSGSLIIVDELHAHKNNLVYNVLLRSSGARRQPLLVGISTCGDMNGLGFQRWKYSEEVLTGTSKNDSHFAILYGIDKEDLNNLHDERVWYKANPNLGVSKQIGSMRSEFIQAQSLVSEQADFILKNFNYWVESSSSWLTHEDLEACTDDSLNLSDFEGRDCVIGFDYAPRADLSAVTLLFPDPDEPEKFTAFHKHWICQGGYSQLPKDIQRNFNHWSRNGTLEITEGNSTDIRKIMKFISDCKERFKVQLVSHDGYYKNEIFRLSEDLNIDDLFVEIQQSIRKQSEPATKFERLLKERKIKFNDDKLFKWCCLNAVIHTDQNENIKVKNPDTDRNRKIDSVISTINAIALLSEKPRESIYESRGMIML